MRTIRDARLVSVTCLLLILAACGSSAGSPTATSPPPSATEEPTPSPTPPDPAEVFLGALQEPTTWLRAEFTGTKRVGDTTFAANGTYESTRFAFLAVTDETDADVSHSEQRFVDGRNYTRSGDGLWFAGRGDWIEGSLIEVLRTGRCTTATESDGTATVEVAPADIHALADSLGLTDVSFSGSTGSATGSASLTIGTDCELATLDLQISATSAYGVTWVWALAYEFDPTGLPPVIEPPERAYVLAGDTFDLGYLMAIPDGWERTRRVTDDGTEWDYYVGPIEGELQVWVMLDVSDWTANEFFQDEVEWINGSEDFNGTVETNEALDVPGATARLLTAHPTQNGESWFWMGVLIFTGSAAYELDWYSPLGDEEEDRAVLEEIVSTMAFATSIDL